MPSQPPNLPQISKPTPVVLDELLIETTDSNKALYDRQLEFGHLYPDQIRYPGFRLVAVKPTQYGQVQYVWANGFTAQDSYNAAKEYAGDANGFPIFSRSYRVLRSDYLRAGPSTKGLPFTGLVAVAVTAGGTGYTHDFSVSFTGGSGSGATGVAIVSNGAVVGLVLTAVGSGYTAAPTVDVSAGDGTGATAVAVVQPAAAVLVSEKHGKLPEDDPYTSLYDKVTLIYETLPGPYIHYNRNDSVLGPVSGTRRSVLYSGQSSSITKTTRTTYEPREGSAIVFTEVIETNLIPGQPLAGQRYIRHMNVTETYRSQVQGYNGASGSLHTTGSEGTLGVEQTPVDEGVARVETLDLDAIRTALGTVWFSWESRTSIRLPNVLTGLVATWNENYGDGADSHPSSNQRAEFSGPALLTAAVRPRASAQASATLIPDVQPEITYFSEAGSNLLVKNYVFYFYGHLTEADVIARLQTLIGGTPTITALPVFKPKMHVITCKGQQVSVRADADSSASLSANADNTAVSSEWGNGYSRETGASVRTIALPPTIHDVVAITGDSTSKTRTVSASVNASTVTLYKDSTPEISAIVNAPAATTATAAGEITPAGLASTGGTIPTSGLTIVDTNVSIADYGMLLVHAAVCDMSQLA